MNVWLCDFVAFRVRCASIVFDFHSVSFDIAHRTLLSMISMCRRTRTSTQIHAHRNRLKSQPFAFVCASIFSDFLMWNSSVHNLLCLLWSDSFEKGNTMSYLCESILVKLALVLLFKATIIISIEHSAGSTNLYGSGWVCFGFTVKKEWKPLGISFVIHQYRLNFVHFIQ